MKTRSTKGTELAIKVIAACALIFTLGLFMVNPAFAFADTLDQTPASPVAVAQEAGYAKTATASDATQNAGTSGGEEVIADNSTPTSAAQDAKASTETGITTGRNAGTTALFVFGIAIAAFVVTAASVTVTTRRKK